jgi:tetratricopeptide (TPR) repeat protein
LSLQAIDAQQRGRWDQAETLYATAVQKCPTDERARHGYAEALWQRGALDEAVAQMEEAVRLSGNDPERRVQLGGMYLHRGEAQRAGQQASLALAADPQHAGAWALSGQVQQAQGERDAALASFHRALSLRANYPQVQIAIAEIYQQQNRPQRALATLQKLSESYRPDAIPGEVLIREGFALRALGRHQDAATALAQAAGRGNPSAALYFELAQSQLQAGDASAARSSVQAALALEPQHAGCMALMRELPPAGGVIAAANSPRQTQVQ